MKRQDITPKIIELAKMIAELWKMEIYEGVWVQDNYGKPSLELATKTYLELYLTESITLEKHWFPIPDIIDCEQKLLELGYESMNLQRRPFKLPWMANVWDAESHDLDANTIKRWEDKGKSLHEIALSVLFKALRKKGK